MLDKRYGLKYSMPHSIVHIVDNSMYTGDLPLITADDPSIYSTIVVTGTPIGVDNEIVSINRSDILNVAFGMSAITKTDIEKYGQTITYPSDLINQNVPIKMLRVTPDEATYAFSCLLVQWRIVNGRILDVRYKTTDGDANDGIPAGKILRNFKNPRRLHEAFVNNTPTTVDDYDGTTWNQRVLMTFISAGRGSGYNNFNYTINQVQQSRRPANIKYLFTTFDNTNNAVVEKFFASLFNENNELRPEAIDPVNTAISKRVSGSSVLIPTLNESAVRELYKIYMQLLKKNIDDKIYTAAVEEVDYNEKVYKTMSLNIFDPIFGRYIYEGDSDVKLPFMRVEMIDVDVPRLDQSHRLTTVIGNSETTRESDNIAALVNNEKTEPVELQEQLLDSLYGIKNSSDLYHVGNVYLTSETATSLLFTTSINQFTGIITNIPITYVRDLSNDGNVKKPIATTVKIGDSYTDENISTAVKDALQEKINNKVYTPTYTIAGSTITFNPDMIIYIDGKHKNLKFNNGGGVSTWGLAYVTYTSTSTIENPTIETVTVYSTKADIYPRLVYPNTTVTSFAYKPGSSYYSSPGSTIVDGGMTDVDTTITTNIGENAAVYVNGYRTRTRDTEYDKCTPILVSEDMPFVVTTPPSAITINKSLNGEMYDLMMLIGGEVTTTFKEGVSYTIKRDNYDTNKIDELVAGYADEDVVGLEGLSDMTFTVSGVKYFTDADNKYINCRYTIPVGYHTYKTDDPTRSTLISSMTLTPVSQAITTYPTKDKYTLELVPVTVDTYNAVTGESAPTFAENTYYKAEDSSYVLLSEEPDDWASNYTNYYTKTSTTETEGFAPEINLERVRNITRTATNEPYTIVRYVVSGPIGSIYNYGFADATIPSNYYEDTYGINPTSEAGGVRIAHGSTGFFDEINMNPIAFKWRYSELLVKAYKGLIDPRIKSPIRCPAKYLFDGGTNTIIGQKILPYMSYSASDIIQASTIFTDDEKEMVQLDEDIVKNIGYYDQDIGIDVKQAMYDLMEYRCYYGLPEDKRPIGPGSGLSLHLDSCITSASTIRIMNQSFIKRFVNPNASWDIGGYTSITDGITYTYTKHIVQNLFTHMKNYSINKPYVGSYSQIPQTEYSSFFPDLDTTDWEERELYYQSGGNAWIMDVNGNLQRKSQRSLYREGDTSDLIQESNMRTLSLLVYMLQNKIDSYLLEYNDDGVLKTLKEEVDNMFSNWPGNLVQALDISFERDINPYDGGEIVVCYCNVTFRGLILRVPIIVNIQRRNNSGENT